jgi:hypothetical protein
VAATFQKLEELCEAATPLGPHQAYKNSDLR